MEQNILVSTKKILGLEEEYTPFDLDVVTHINAAFSTLQQLGIGNSPPIFIETGDETWDSLGVPSNQLSVIKTYIFLKVRMLFDPPGTSFVLEAMNKQIAEMEWRLNVFREYSLEEEW